MALQPAEDGEDIVENYSTRKQTYTLYGRIASKKNSKQVSRAGSRTFVRSSDAWMRCEKELLRQLDEQFSFPCTPPYRVRYDFYMKGNAADGDNLCAGVADCLMKAGVLTDDKEIMEATWVKHIGTGEYKTVIDIESLAAEQ